MINDLPELLLGTDARMISGEDKKIICDFDDFEMGEDGARDTSMMDGIMQSQMEGSKSPRVLKVL